MKKLSYIGIGIMIGAVLSFTIPAAAQEINSLIGKEVQEETDVLLNGEQLNVKAIIIDGTSFAPVRAFGEAVGYNVDYKNEKVILNKEGGTVDKPKPIIERPPTRTLDDVKRGIEAANTQIKEKTILIEQTKKLIADDKYIDQREQYKQLLKTYQDTVDTFQKRLVELQAEKAEFEKATQP